MPPGKSDATPDASTSQVPDFKLEEFLPYRLNVVAGLTSQALSRIYAERYRLSVPEWRVLATLGQYREITGKAIGQHCHMHKTKVSRAVAALQKRKLVARKVNRDDLREALLSLTLAGQAIFEDLVPLALDFAHQLLNAVEPADRAALDRALRCLAEGSAKLVKEQNRR